MRTNTPKQTPHSLLEAAELAATLLRELKDGGAENPELEILEAAIEGAKVPRPRDDLDNTYRAAVGKSTVDFYRSVKGPEDLEYLISDLITELGHYASVALANVAVVDMVRRGVRNWVAERETDDCNQAEIIRRVEISIGEPL